MDKFDDNWELNFWISLIWESINEMPLIPDKDTRMWGHDGKTFYCLRPSEYNTFELVFATKLLNDSREKILKTCESFGMLTSSEESRSEMSNIIYCTVHAQFFEMVRNAYK